MGEPKVIRAGHGELVGDAPERRVEILSDRDALHATWSRFGPGREGADLHVHRHHSDLFYVLEGELTIRLGPEGAGVPVPAGNLARVPPLVVHGFRNGSDAEVRYLNLHAPGQAFADFMRAMHGGREFSYDQHPPPVDGGRPPTEAAIGGRGPVTERAGERVELLADVEEIAVSEHRVAPGAPSSPPHVHRRHVESLYVLEGELAITVNGRGLRAEVGSWVQVPSGVPHAVAFPSSKSVRFLDLHTPSCGFGTFLLAVAGTPDEQAAASHAGFDQERVPRA